MAGTYSVYKSKRDQRAVEVGTTHSFPEVVGNSSRGERPLASKSQHTDHAEEEKHPHGWHC